MLQTKLARITYSLPARANPSGKARERSTRGRNDSHGLALPGGDVACRRPVSGDGAPLRLDGVFGAATDCADLSPGHRAGGVGVVARSEAHTSELQSLMRISFAVFCLNKKN